MAENLWALREQKRLSVATLASRAGLPIGLIMEYEAGTRSIDPRHLSRLARALYVEETELKLRCDPKPGGGQLERQAPRPQPRPASPDSEPAPTYNPPGAPPAAMPRQRAQRPPRPLADARPPAPARQSQLAHLNDLIQRLGKDRSALEAEQGKPIDELDRLAASKLLGKLQVELRTAPSPDRHRAYLPEAVDQHELRYLSTAKDEGATLDFSLFDGSKASGPITGFGPYAITLMQPDGSELTINKLAIVSYRKSAELHAAEDGEQDQ